MKFKNSLKIEKISNVLLLKNFVAIYPQKAVNLTLFDNLTTKHKLSIIKYSFFSTLKNIFKISISKEKNLFLIFNLWSTGYHHFITETLLKIAIYKQEFQNVTILVPANTPNFVNDAFKLLDIESLVVHKELTLYKELNIIENPNSGLFNPRHLKILQNEFKQFQNLTNKKNIFLTRRKSRSRKILNEQEIYNFLDENSFSVIETDEMSFLEQVNLFSNANILISSHGAGLTNMVFMPENSIIIELMPEYSKYDKFEINKCFENMSYALNFKYIRIDCKRFDYKTQFDTCDILIDSQELKNKISLIREKNG